MGWSQAGEGIGSTNQCKILYDDERMNQNMSHNRFDLARQSRLMMIPRMHSNASKQDVMSVWPAAEDGGGKKEAKLCSGACGPSSLSGTN